jgi:hypothetical protein
MPEDSGDEWGDMGDNFCEKEKELGDLAREQRATKYPVRESGIRASMQKPHRGILSRVWGCFSKIGL